MKHSILAIVNPAAGFGKAAKLLGPTMDRLRAAGIEFDVAETKHAGHATELAREAYRQGYRRMLPRYRPCSDGFCWRRRKPKKRRKSSKQC
jgi:diacylglycerol kinase family enzyme